MLLDTHALVWWLADPSRLSARARRAVQAAAGDGAICVSTASVLEITTLVRRGRLAFTTSLAQWLEDLRALPELHIESIDFDVAAQGGLPG